MNQEIQDALVEKYVDAVLLITKVESLLLTTRVWPERTEEFVSTALGLIEGRQTLEARLQEDS